MARGPEDLGTVSSGAAGVARLSYQPYEGLWGVLRARGVCCGGKLELNLAGGRRARSWRRIVRFHGL